MDTIFNTDGCFYRALDDEPIFVLLARDPCFAETIRAWETSRQALIGRGEKPQGDHPMLLEALATATAGVAWRNKSTDPANGYDAGQHARWHVEKAPERVLVEAGPRKPKHAPTGGFMLPYHEWLTVERNAMPLGNRFLIGDIERELVFWENENYRQPGLPAKWTGYYPINNSLQKDMLWCAYEDWRNKAHQTVSAIKRLAGGDLKWGEDEQPIKMLSPARISEFLDYATSYGEFDENTPNGTRCPVGGTAMNDYRRNAIVIYKRVLGLLPEDYVTTTPQPVTGTSGAGKIDPAKEALWIDMAEERGFMSASEAEKARAALPEGTKAAITSKHLTFIVRDLARKVATGLRQVTGDMDLTIKKNLVSQSERADDLREEFGKIIDRINGYAAELEAGEAEAARFRSRPVKMHPVLGAPYEPDEQPLGDPYKRFAESYQYEDMTVEEARAIVERFRKRFPDLLRIYDPTAPEVEVVPPGVYYGVEGANFYDAKTCTGMGVPFYSKWRSRVMEFPVKVHDEIEFPAGYPHNWQESLVDEMVSDTLRQKDQFASRLRAAMADPGRWSGKRIDPSQYRKAESDTLDVTDTPEMPPHRFTMFTKARGWAYGRGLEINPAHIPDMLDRMDKDGWHLQAVFGGVEPTKVGMLFKRDQQHADFTKPWEHVGQWCGKGLWVAGGLSPHRLQQLRDRITAGERLYQDEEPYRAPPMPPSVAEMMAAPTEGVDDMGRGLEP